MGGIFLLLYSVLGFQEEEAGHSPKAVCEMLVMEDLGNEIKIPQKDAGLWCPPLIP